MNSALTQLEEERGIPREKIFEAIEMALSAAYKKDYGKKNQIIRAKLDPSSGRVEFLQVKIVVDESMLKEDPPELAEGEVAPPEEPTAEDDDRVRFNEDRHIMIEDARKIRADVQPNDEMAFPLESRDDYGRIAAQTAKQVIIQKIREAEREATIEEFSEREGDIVSGRVQQIDRGNVYVDLGKTIGFLSKEEQIPGERYRQGERLKAYLFAVEDGPRGINLRLSRSHPKFLEKLFAVEAPEIANGSVIVEAIAREAGSRAKMAVRSTDNSIDPIGSCVGQRGVRVATVISELGGEKIDIIEWSSDPAVLIENALSPAKVGKITLDNTHKQATILVEEDQFSLAIGRGGQNVRLAAKLTGWKLDIKGTKGGQVVESVNSEDEIDETIEKLAGVEKPKEEAVETPAEKKEE